jgi:hypothetical protein
MDRLLRWWWSDPFNRHIRPSSRITVPDFVRCRIREVLARALRLAPDDAGHGRHSRGHA